MTAEAEKAEKEGNREKASELYLYVTFTQRSRPEASLIIVRRASSLYTISRFPAPRSEKQRYAWEEGKKVSKKGMALRERPTQEVIIPHKHGLPSEGKNIPVYYHLPPGTTKDKTVPVVIIFTGLDGYRTELAVWIEGWSQKGVGVVILEIPG